MLRRPLEPEKSTSSHPVSPTCALVSHVSDCLAFCLALVSHVGAQLFLLVSSCCGANYFILWADKTTDRHEHPCCATESAKTPNPARACSQCTKSFPLLGVYRTNTSVRGGRSDEKHWKVIIYQYLTTRICQTCRNQCSNMFLCQRSVSCAADFFSFHHRTFIRCLKSSHEKRIVKTSSFPLRL